MGGIRRQKVPFVLASCAHGTMILNHLDWRRLDDAQSEMGVGSGILIDGSSDLEVTSMVCALLLARRDRHGPGAIAIDCGANIGVYTLDLARAMEGWGLVLAFEPQERIYYALAGNIALNNLFNARAFHKAMGREPAMTSMPAPDYQVPGQFGGLSLNGDGSDIGQPTGTRAVVEMLSIDSLKLPRLDFLKVDVEGMELDVLQGGRETITKYRPYVFAEWHICGAAPLNEFMASIGFDTVMMGMNMLCAPRGDDGLEKVRGYIAELIKGAAA